MTDSAHSDAPQTSGQPTPAEQLEVTRLLVAWRNGDRDALDQLMPVVYQHLREIAHLQMRREQGMRTLQPTELVHEVYLRLMDADVDWQDRAHFYAIAGRQMRRLLVDEARKRRRWKRGRERPLQLADIDEPAINSSPEKLLDLDHALDRLSSFDERKARVVEARLFAGLTIDETARVLELSTATVERELKLARSWLTRELRAPATD